MKKNKGFMKSLNRSTQVTILSCASFIAMTVILLVFFSVFPITPSERIMASIGRENILENNNPNSEDITAISAVTTKKQPAVTTAVKSSVSTGRTTTKTFKIVITTGSGFMRNGRTPTDDGNGNTKTTVIFDDPPVPTPDPGYTYPIYTTPPENPEEPNIPEFPIEEPTDPFDPPVTDIPVWTEPPVDIPPVTDVPVWTEPPVDVPPVIDVPVWTEPPVFIDPNPPVVPDPNEGGGSFTPDPVDEW